MKPQVFQGVEELGAGLTLTLSVLSMGRYGHSGQYLKHKYVNGTTHHKSMMNVKLWPLKLVKKGGSIIKAHY